MRHVITVVVAALLLGVASGAMDSVQSPRGAETFAIIPPPPAKKVQLSWKFPTNLETPDLIFKVYHTTDLTLPLRLWAVLTNVPGKSRTVEVAANQARDFFTLTASNYLGESGFATK